MRVRMGGARRYEAGDKGRKLRPVCRSEKGSIGAVWARWSRAVVERKHEGDHTDSGGEHGRGAERCAPVSACRRMGCWRLTGDESREKRERLRWTDRAVRCAQQRALLPWATEPCRGGKQGTKVRGT